MGCSSRTGEFGRWVLFGIKLQRWCCCSVWLARAGSRLTAVALGLIIGGAIGNAIDRLAYGAVADFVLFHITTASWQFRWYVFNLADAAIVAGVIGLLYETLFPGPRRKSALIRDRLFAEASRTAPPIGATATDRGLETDAGNSWTEAPNERCWRLAAPGSSRLQHAEVRAGGGPGRRRQDLQQSIMRGICLRRRIEAADRISRAFAAGGSDRLAICRRRRRSRRRRNAGVAASMPMSAAGPPSAANHPSR